MEELGLDRRIGIMESETGISKLDPIATLGRGTFGKVILARASMTDRRLPFRRHGSPQKHDDLIALKIIPKSALKTSKRIQKTETELRVLTTIAPSSSFLVACKFALQTDDLLVYMMDFSVGGDLRTHLRRVGRLSESIVVVIAMQVVLGLEHLHSNGVLYRDLKPDNLLISASGRIRLADFGLSKFLPKAQSRCRLYRVLFPCSKECVWGTTRTACGTPMYQAPEMVKNKPHSLEADWWAFGNLLFELLTGKCPFNAETVGRVHELILENHPKYPSYVSYNAVQLISGLLTSNRKKRLGYGVNGADAVKDHHFFHNIQNEVTWERLERIRPSARSPREEEDQEQAEETAYFFLPHRQQQEGFIREYIAPNKSPLMVAGFTPVPNDAFADLISMEVGNEMSSTSGATMSGDDFQATLALQ